MFKSEKQPRCRYCGNLIKKYTEQTRFGTLASRADLKTVRPASREEAQKHVNHEIVSIGWAAHYLTEVKEHGRYIDKVGTWDGASYVDEFFCNGDHAKQFAYVMASNGHATKAYAEAVRLEKLGKEIVGS